MNGHSFRFENSPTIPSQWVADIQTTFFKCTNWQLEETLDPVNCPHHYYCNSSYLGNYPPYIDLIVFAFIICSFLTTIIFMVIEIMGSSSTSSRWEPRITRWRRYLLPSGPVSMPLMLIIMAKGHRINTHFPLSVTGPAILQLVRVSSIAFDDSRETMSSDIKYVFLESSAISGILHLSIYLDSVILPFYTGLDALVSSRFSGECLSCVCRKRVLVVGGSAVLFRGWSVTNAMVVGALCLRVFCRISINGSTEKVRWVKIVLEVWSWVLISVECLYLVMIVPGLAGSWVRVASYGGVYVLIFLYALRRLCDWIAVSKRGRLEQNNSRRKDLAVVYKS